MTPSTLTAHQPPPLPATTSAGIAFHRYAGPVELPGMMAANARMRARAGMVEPIDMAAITHRYTHLVNSDPLEDCIVATRDGDTVGYARVEWHDLTDGGRQYECTLVVAPDAWGTGTIEALLAWCEARLRQVAAGHVLPAGAPRWFSTVSLDGEAETERLLAAGGYEIARLGADMVRADLEGVPDVPVPEGYVLRAPLADELRLVNEMNVEAFREHWGEHEGDPDDHFREWTEDPRFDRDLVVVAWAGEAPACLVGIMLDHRDDGSTGAYVSSVGTHPAHRRRGLARATLAAALRVARTAGAGDAYLGVDAQNQNRAFALYEHLGFRVVAGSRTWRKPLTEETDT